MTKKDYIRIAAALFSARVPNSIGDLNKGLYNNGIDMAVVYLTRALVDDNPRFDRVKFQEACAFGVGTAPAGGK